MKLIGIMVLALLSLVLGGCGSAVPTGIEPYIQTAPDLPGEKLEQKHTTTVKKADASGTLRVVEEVESKTEYNRMMAEMLLKLEAMRVNAQAELEALGAQARSLVMPIGCADASGPCNTSFSTANGQSQNIGPSDQEKLLICCNNGGCRCQ